MKRKLVSLLMCMVMCFSFVPTAAFAATSTKSHSATTSSMTSKKTVAKKTTAKKATVKKTAKKSAVKSATKKTTVAKKTSTTKNVQTVYWVDKTKVYHTSANCRTLKKSKAVHSGTLAQAQKAGHTQLCKVCGK